MKISCPVCGREYEITEDQVSARLECECGEKFSVRNSEREIPPAAPAAPVPAAAVPPSSAADKAPAGEKEKQPLSWYPEKGQTSLATADDSLFTMGGCLTTVFVLLGVCLVIGGIMTMSESGIASGLLVIVIPATLLKIMDSVSGMAINIAEIRKMLEKHNHNSK